MLINSGIIFSDVLDIYFKRKQIEPEFYSELPKTQAQKRTQDPAKHLRWSCL